MARTEFSNWTLAENILKTLKDPNLKWGDRRALRTALNNVVGMKGQIGKVNALMNGINRGLISVGSQVSSIVSVLSSADKAQQMAETRQKTDVEKAALAAKERIQKLALEKGVWNQGIGLQPVENPIGTNSSQDGESGEKTTGSFIGG